MNPMQPRFELMEVAEVAEDIGKNFKFARAARGWRQEDLSKVSGASLQAVKNLEGGGNVELMTFLKVARALGMDRAVWEGCRPVPQTLDELERIEHARTATTRVRSKP